VTIGESNWLYAKHVKKGVGSPRHRALIKKAGRGIEVQIEHSPHRKGARHQEIQKRVTLNPSKLGKKRGQKKKKKKKKQKINWGVKKPRLHLKPQPLAFLKKKKKMADSNSG